MQFFAITRRDADSVRHPDTEGLHKSPVDHITTAMDFSHARRYHTYTSDAHQTLNINNYNIIERHT